MKYVSLGESIGVPIFFNKFQVLPEFPVEAPVHSGNELHNFITSFIVAFKSASGLFNVNIFPVSPIL
jgi:hypothetical protein